MDLYRLVKKPFFGRYQARWLWPESVEKDDWSQVKIQSAAGATLAGLSAPALGDRAKGSIICAHPMGNEAKAYFLKRGHADLLRRNGYNVLLFDFNGFGESENGSFEYPDDVSAAGDAARKLWPKVPLGILGTSFGGAWTICALARHPEMFEAAVIESAFTTLDEFWSKYPLPYATLKLLNVVMPQVAERLRPIAQIARNEDTPLLLVYGEKDSVTPIEMGERLLNAAGVPNARRSLWVARGAEHTKALQTDPVGYEAHVLPFLDGIFA